LSQTFSQVSLDDSVIKNEFSFKDLKEIEEEEEGCIEEEGSIDDNNEEDDDMDLYNPSCYATIDAISIFFTKKREETVSGLLSVNNIIEQQKFKEEQVIDALLLWSTIDDMKNLLLQENFKLEEIKITNFEVLTKDHTTNLILVSTKDRQYFVIKRIGGHLFLLDPTREAPEYLSVNLVAFLNVKMIKNPFTIFKVLKSNSEIIINHINSSGTVHEEVYGK
jgi:hypothetical protein